MLKYIFSSSSLKRIIEKHAVIVKNFKMASILRVKIILASNVKLSHDAEFPRHSISSYSI